MFSGFEQLAVPSCCARKAFHGWVRICRPGTVQTVVQEETWEAVVFVVMGTMCVTWIVKTPVNQASQGFAGHPAIIFSISVRPKLT